MDGLVRQLAGALHAVERQASTDQLTGLANRRRFYDRWSTTLTTSTGPTALLYLDLDGFKPVNDTYGHEAGDAVLVEVAARINAAIRVGDVVARLGGDEFAVILPDTDDELAGTVAERILKSLSEPFDALSHEVCVGASIGVITATPDANPEAELRRADQAMYTAKNSGRNRVHHSFPVTSAV
ncbi:GGDEF domain-containing protein [Actinoplanes sp. TRM 88003]|uniref:GGDEF domain-containing protein n=2 Tax=Paractinoplanes aksuensis TaxID=2939490 RepID=A0ABT1E1Q6_9ACTN|nr:GGDEF domain-containing protein [Actinoplanes aksuensis]